MITRKEAEKLVYIYVKYFNDIAIRDKADKMLSMYLSQFDTISEEVKWSESLMLGELALNYTKQLETGIK